MTATMGDSGVEKRYSIGLTPRQVRRVRLPGYPVAGTMQRQGSVGYVYECGGA